MGSVADAYDNSMAESFDSASRSGSWFTVTGGRTVRGPGRLFCRVLEGLYNTRLRHFALGHLSPSEYEAVGLRGDAGA
jgi:hypothetical protein